MTTEERLDRLERELARARRGNRWLLAVLGVAVLGVALGVWALARSVATSMEMAQILSGLLTPMIAILAGYIAWRQYQTARARLKLDLYERRFRVYRGLMDLVAAVVCDGGASRWALARYYSETNEKQFLFGPDVIEYMKTAREKAVRLRQVSRKIKNPPGQQEQAAAVEEEQEQLLSWFDTQVDEAQAKFAKYLDFKTNL